MFKSSRWRSEKNKVKAEFKLQFYVTQVSQSVVDGLTLSVVPGDVGKPTAKLERATIRDGSCKWENPVYETVKFVRDAKTGKINEKIYYFLVSVGRAKSKLLGEVSINISDYAEAKNSSSISLPLKNSNSDAVLHIYIQKLQANIEPREVEDFDDARVGSQGTNLKTYLSDRDINGSTTSNYTEDKAICKGLHGIELNGDCRASSGSDITLSSSESSSGLDTPRELKARNENHHESVCVPSFPLKQVMFLSTETDKENQRLQSVWSIGSDQGLSIDDSSDDMLPREGSEPVERSEQVANNEIEKLKAELVSISRKAEVSELELQTLRKQIVKESKKTHDLSREIVILKEERDSLGIECEKLKAFKLRMEGAKSENESQLEDWNMEALLNEMKKELNHEKELNASLQLQLQKTEETNNELILAMRNLEEMLEQKNSEILNLCDHSRLSVNAVEMCNTFSKCQSDDDEEQKALEKLVKQHSNANETYLLEQRVMDLYSELEFYKREKDELEMHMEQLALDYEILKQENHDMSYKLEQCELQETLSMKEECTSSDILEELETHINGLDKELKQKSKDYSDALITIKKLEAHIQGLDEELEQQAEGFEADLEAVTRAKIEQEQRAILAEEDLRKTRCINADTAQRLQKEFKWVSLQIASTFDANEKVAAKAVAEFKELQLQKSQLDKKLELANKEHQIVKEDYEAKLCELSSIIDLKTSQIEQMFLELDMKSKLLEKQGFQKEKYESLSKEVVLLECENEKLKSENISLREGQSLMIRNKNVERNELVTTIAFINNGFQELQKELSRMRNLKNEREISFGCLQAELEVLSTRCGDLKHYLVEDEIEKEKLRNQVFQLNNDLKKIEEFNSINWLGLSVGSTSSSGEIETFSEITNSTSMQSSHTEAAALREKIMLLEINGYRSNIFMGDDHVPKENRHTVLYENQNTTLTSYEECRNTVSVERDDEISSDKELKACKAVSRENCDNFLSELALLRESNKLMESELKEMQERYSELSLKFAEVEGERQQLVMTLRSIKNSKKI